MAESMNRVTFYSCFFFYILQWKNFTRFSIAESLNRVTFYSCVFFFLHFTMIEFYQVLDGWINEKSKVLLVFFCQGLREGDAHAKRIGVLVGTLNLKNLKRRHRSFWTWLKPSLINKRYHFHVWVVCQHSSTALFISSRATLKDTLTAKSISVLC